MSRKRLALGVALLVLSAVLLRGLAVRAGGPLAVGGTFGVPGQPFVWTIDPLTYWTDLGNLGNQSNAQAETLVVNAFNVWQGVPTASITFNAAGKLGADVTGTNILAVFNDLEDCAGALGSVAQALSIIYDRDGSAIDALLGVGNSELTLGFAQPSCPNTDGANNFFERGFAVLNGLWIDGQPDSESNPEVSLGAFQGVFIHEFGHLIGLDHSQINVNCYNIFSICSTDDLQGIPLMFPFLLEGQAATLRTDDVAAFSELYPEAGFLTSTGRIRGQILFSDGATPGQGFNVIARQVDNLSTGQDESRRVAVSSVSGFLFTACEGNSIVPPPTNDCGPTVTPYGSRDPSLIGYYEIPGLAPGDYTVEVEAIHPDFVLASSVGPIGVVGFEFPVPGECQGEFVNTSPPESDTDQCADQNPIAVTAGGIIQSGADIILNGTPPRFDAWEDE